LIDVIQQVILKIKHAVKACLLGVKKANLLPLIQTDNFSPHSTYFIIHMQQPDATPLLSASIGSASWIEQEEPEAIFILWDMAVAVNDDAGIGKF
jgi:hypothetical protein